MSEIKARTIEEIPYYQGPNAIPGIRFRMAAMDVSGEKIPLSTGMLVRVGPTQKRKILPGPQGITVLAIGATPGKAYEPRR